MSDTSKESDEKKNKDSTVKSSDKKQKLTKWLICINVIAVSVLLCLLIIMIYDKSRNRTILSDTVTNNNSQDASKEEKIDKEINDNMSILYGSLLAGWSYKIDDDTYFSFNKDGSFSGFFDKSNKNVSGYSYEIVYDKDNNYHLLNIYNSDLSSMVSYEISLDAHTGNFILVYPGADSPFILDTEKATFIS